MTEEFETKTSSKVNYFHAKPIFSQGLLKRKNYSYKNWQ